MLERRPLQCLSEASASQQQPIDPGFRVGCLQPLSYCVSQQGRDQWRAIEGTRTTIDPPRSGVLFGRKGHTLANLTVWEKICDSSRSALDIRWQITSGPIFRSIEQKTPELLTIKGYIYLSAGC